MSPPAERRLVEEPVFIMSLMRSGSTLLRCVLDSHSRVHSPPELHLGQIEVALTWGSPTSMRAIGLDERDVRHLLWDRLLHRQLAASGKALIVEKTPRNIEDFADLVACWPRARFIFLRRHPAHVLTSLVRHRVHPDVDSAAAEIRDWADRLDAALASRPGSMVVRYEEMTADPPATFQSLCDFLGVEYEPGMLDYGAFEHGPLAPVLGDWTENIRSGRIRRTGGPAVKVPGLLRRACDSWGY